MKRYLPALLLLAACYKTEYSTELREPGRIEQLTLSPGGTASGTSYNTGKGGGVGYVSVDIPTRYAVVISCMHGKFALNAEGADARAIFYKFKQGDSITIFYREVYHVKDGVRELADLDFIDATPRIVER